MNKQIITFTMSLKQSQFEVDRLENEAKELGIEVNRALYRDLTFDLNNENSRVFVKGVEVTSENCMGMWFRVAGTVSGKYTEGRNLAIRLLGTEDRGQITEDRGQITEDRGQITEDRGQITEDRGQITEDRGVFCANSRGYLEWTRMGKIGQHGVFIENNIPIVPTMVFYTKDQITNYELRITNFFGWEYPIIAKHEKGYQGKSVRKFDNWKQVERFLNRINEKNLGMFLWQKCLPTRWDLRVIVLDGKVIGAMKRTAVGEEFRSNFSLGGAVEKWNLSEDDKNLAEKVAKVCGLDYCGVDIMKNEKNESFVLEVNRQCQFQGFEKATGINVAKLVVEMFLKKG